MAPPRTRTPGQDDATAGPGCAESRARRTSSCDRQSPCQHCVRGERQCVYREEAAREARARRNGYYLLRRSGQGPQTPQASQSPYENLPGSQSAACHVWGWHATSNAPVAGASREEAHSCVSTADTPRGEPDGTPKRKAKAEPNGVPNGHDAKRFKSSVSPEPDEPAPPFGADRQRPALPEKPAVAEERQGEISFQVVNNDGDARSVIILTGLKCIFQKQLPKMPKDYIARLVYDRTHLSIAIVKRPPTGSHAESSGLPGEVVGGITYRPFKGRQFAEIVFCAISSDQQVKGYGAHLMNHLKDYVRATSDVRYFLTYADNYAIGYFKKQGFTKEITLDKPKWMGYIKDYEGGTIMQCSMMSRIRYLESSRMLLKQKAAVHAKIRAVSRSYEVHRPPSPWARIAPGDPLHAIDPLTLPALRATGWSPDMDALARQPRRNPSHSLLLHLLSALQTSSSAWPFLQPVNGDEVADYYAVIKQPMDLSTMESKLDKDQYDTVEDFVKDVLLVVRNCKRYNAETTPYAKAAGKLEKEMWRKIREVPEWSFLEAEGFEGTNRVE
ncbi:histone acetyltransferase [Teratosphaeriaceae sp. CCFEE 6253]|nr:histone acetyltransferase [Teratosphaeriaceae sp. CCFEE 6253]